MNALLSSPTLMSSSVSSVFKSTVPAGMTLRPGTISFSCYSLHRAMHIVVDALNERDTIELNSWTRGIVPYQRTCNAMHLAPHSSAVVSLTSHSATILYYLCVSNYYYYIQAD